MIISTSLALPALPVDLGSCELFIGEIAGTWTEDHYLLEGRPDFAKMKPFTLTMPDNRYWSVGAEIGRAWSAGCGNKLRS